MPAKLVILCAEAIAKDCSETGHLRLRTLLESVLPTSVLLVALSSVPLNHLIQLEEDFPEHFTVIREQWRELCKQCANDYVPLRMKLDRALMNPDEGLDYKAFLLNAYFQEVLDACSVAATTGRRSAEAPRVSSQYILQGALGQSRHNVSDEKMLNVLAEHITELTLSSKYIFQLRQLIQAHENCMGRLKILKLDTCTCSQNNIKTTNWTYCVSHILQRSPIQTLSVTRCCTILNNIICHLVKGRQVDEATLGLESDVNASHDSDELSDVGLYDDMVRDEVASEHPGIKELIVLTCLKEKYHEYDEYGEYGPCFNRYGLECLYSLERLTVSCQASYFVTNNFLGVITKLLKSGSSQLKYLCITAGRFSMETIKELGQCLNAANDSKKEVIINNWTSIYFPTVAGEAFVSGNCPKFLRSTISNLTYSESRATWNFGSSISMRDYYLQLFTIFFEVYNPEYFNIFCSNHSSPLPNHSLQDAPNSSEGPNLRKLTVVLNTTRHYLGRVTLLRGVLCAVKLILKERSKEVDVDAWSNEILNIDDIYDNDDIYDDDDIIDIDYSAFKTVEMKLLDE